MMGDANNNPKPSSRPQVMYFPGQGYAVVDARGNRITGFYSGKDRAQTRCEALRAEADARAKRMKRPCLCCKQEFLSEGAHNRMCNRCRHKEAGDDPVRPYITRGRRAA